MAEQCPEDDVEIASAICNATGWTLPLAREFASAHTARRAVSAFAVEAQVDDAIAAIVASELVTNAVLHGAAPVTLAVDWDGVCMLVQVSDGAPDVAAVKAPRPDPAKLGGRGLMLIENICRRWGVAAHPVGKMVWAEFEPGPAILGNGPTTLQSRIAHAQGIVSAQVDCTLDEARRLMRARATYTALSLDYIATGILDGNIRFDT
jgi:anti-sigma regulatory factor (Ser/Thr protein kinase)